MCLCSWYRCTDELISSPRRLHSWHSITRSCLRFRSWGVSEDHPPAEGYPGTPHSRGGGAPQPRFELNVASTYRMHRVNRALGGGISSRGFIVQLQSLRKNQAEYYNKSKRKGHKGQKRNSDPDCASITQVSEKCQGYDQCDRERKLYERARVLESSTATGAIESASLPSWDLGRFYKSSAGRTFLQVS
jgi:hypothetical protein